MTGSRRTCWTCTRWPTGRTPSTGSGPRGVRRDRAGGAARVPHGQRRRQPRGVADCSAASPRPCSAASTAGHQEEPREERSEGQGGAAAEPSWRHSASRHRGSRLALRHGDRHRTSCSLSEDDPKGSGLAIAGLPLTMGGVTAAS
ncbi:hypothetical protein QJS66_03440 [Kocuria rhizophila]|nr:hypothetical protein QJS66_03440 [Kocuria rhizophila]